MYDARPKGSKPSSRKWSEAWSCLYSYLSRTFASHWQHPLSLHHFPYVSLRPSAQTSEPVALTSNGLIPPRNPMINRRRVVFDLFRWQHIAVRILFHLSPLVFQVVLSLYPSPCYPHPAWTPTTWTVPYPGVQDMVSLNRSSANVRTAIRKNTRVWASSGRIPGSSAPGWESEPRCAPLLETACRETHMAHYLANESVSMTMSPTSASYLKIPLTSLR